MANGILTKTHFMSPVEEDSKKLDASEVKQILFYRVSTWSFKP